MNEAVTILKSKQLSFGRIELRSDDILTFEPDPGKFKDYTIPILEEMLPVFLEFTEGEPKPYFCDNRYVLGIIGSEEKKYISEHFDKFASYFAMTENSPITRFIVNSFFKVLNPNIEMKMFKEKGPAIKWLKEVSSK